MRLAWLVVPALSLVSRTASGDCPPADPFAIEAANQGDRAKATDLEAAIEKYQRAHELDPKSHRILWKLALAYFKKESWADVQSTLVEAVKLAPSHAGYTTTLGIALARQSQWREASIVLERAIHLDPNIADAHFERAETALHLGEERTALTHFTKAIELSPNDAVFYASLADLYIRLGFPEHAEKVLFTGEANVTDEAKKFVLYSLHGSILDGKHDAPGAVGYYEKAKKACGSCSDRSQHIASFNLGAAYASLSPPRKSEAMQQLQSFYKMVCKGAAAQRYADQCAQAQQIATKLGGTVQ